MNIETARPVGAVSMFAKMLYAYGDKTMKLNKHILLLTLLVLLAAACAGPLAPPTVSTPETNPQPTSTPLVEETFPEPLQHIVDQARASLASQFGLSLDNVIPLSVEAVEWPNGCLGIDYLDRSCTEAIVPGYRILLQANGQTYEYRSNQDGSLLWPATLYLSASQNPVAEIARKALAEQLNIPLEQISVVSVQSVEWPDGCLGVQSPGKVCITVIVPGFQILLQANGQTYEYHTNQDGSQMIFVGAVERQSGTPVLVYSVEGGIAGFCSTVEIYVSGKVTLSSCNTIPQQATLKLKPDQLRQVLAWVDQYNDFGFTQSDDAIADQMTVTLIFDGDGFETVPDEVRRQMQDLAAGLFASVRGPVEGAPDQGSSTPEGNSTAPGQRTDSSAAT